MKQKKWILLGLFFLLWILWISTILLIRLELNGDKVIYLKPGEEYQEEGAEAYFLNQRLSVQITDTKVSDNQDYVKYYSARNLFGVVKKKQRKIIVLDQTQPRIQLKGSYYVVVRKNQKFSEPGYQAIDSKDGDLTRKVKVSGTVDTSKLGVQTLTYEVKDKSGNNASVTRKVHVIASQFQYVDEYDNIDNQVRGWGHGNKKNHIRSEADVRIEELAKYNAFYMGPDEKKIYLTFDEGSNDTYLKEIVQVLREKKVKATMFLCRNYMLSNQDLIKEMVQDGHLIGNHTWHHKSMPTLANANTYSEYLEELTKTAETYKEITGKEMPKIYREPAGEWSYRSLKIVQDMGYRTYFWSAAYMDFGDNVSKETALQKMMEMHHNGVIYLLHPKNKGNYLALADFIDEMRKLGYEFATVDEIK